MENNNCCENKESCEEKTCDTASNHPPLEESKPEPVNTEMSSDQMLILQLTKDVSKMLQIMRAFFSFVADLGLNAGLIRLLSEDEKAELAKKQEAEKAKIQNQSKEI